MGRLLPQPPLNGPLVEELFLRLPLLNMRFAGNDIFMFYGISNHKHDSFNKLRIKGYMVGRQTNFAPEVLFEGIAN